MFHIGRQKEKKEKEAECQSVFRTKKNQNTKHIYKRARICIVTPLPRNKKKAE